MTSKAVAVGVLAAIDEQRLVQDVIDMVNINSPTGSELAMGDYIDKRYSEMGLQVIRQEVEPGRPNVFGILRGTGDGPMLQFDGHLDVSFTGDRKSTRLNASHLGISYA